MLLSLHPLSMRKNTVNVTADGDGWLRTPDTAELMTARTSHFLQANHYADAEDTIPRVRVSQINRNKGRKHALM